MAKKPTVTTISSGYASNTQLNANFVALRDAFDNTLSLDGSAPNAFSGDMDLGGNDILNGGNIVANDIVVAGSSVAASAAAAAASAASAEASYDAFDDRYLGAKASAPTVDNDGDALTAGALYFDTTTSNMFVYTGSAWNAAYTEITGGLLPANNLSDVSNAATSLFNLGLTATAAEINTLDGITSTTAELNILDGVTASTAEINHLVGVTSSIQTQVDAKYTEITQTTATWEAGTDTTESVVSAAKVAAAIAASPSLTLDDYTESFGVTGSEGYTIFPNGLVMQWGRTSTLAGDTLVTLPIAFPNAHITGVASPSQSGALTGNVSGYYVVISLTQCRITHDASGNSDSSPVGWIAIGY